MGLSVNDNGQFALLGGRKSLALINLSDTKSVAFRSMRNVGKWEVRQVFVMVFRFDLENKMILDNMQGRNQW